MRKICLSPELKENYEDLFNLGYQSADDLQQQYAAAFGDSFSHMAPALADLLATVGDDERDFTYEREICDGVKLFHVMTLDMARRAPRPRAAPAHPPRPRHR